MTEGLLIFTAIIIILSLILATSVVYENNITANVAKETEISENGFGLKIIEVRSVNELNQLNEGWYQIINGYVYYLDSFSSYVSLYIKVRNPDEQKGLLIVDADGTARLDKTFTGLPESEVADEEEFFEEEEIGQINSKLKGITGFQILSDEKSTSLKRATKNQAYYFSSEVRDFVLYDRAIVIWDNAAKEWKLKFYGIFGKKEYPAKDVYKLSFVNPELKDVAQQLTEIGAPPENKEAQQAYGEYLQGIKKSSSFPGIGTISEAQQQSSQSPAIQPITTVTISSSAVEFQRQKADKNVMSLGNLMDRRQGIYYVDELGYVWILDDAGDPYTLGKLDETGQLVKNTAFSINSKGTILREPISVITSGGTVKLEQMSAGETQRTGTLDINSLQEDYIQLLSEIVTPDMSQEDRKLKLESYRQVLLNSIRSATTPEDKQRAEAFYSLHITQLLQESKPQDVERLGLLYSKDLSEAKKPAITGFFPFPAQEIKQNTILEAGQAYDYGDIRFQIPAESELAGSKVVYARSEGGIFIITEKDGQIRSYEVVGLGGETVTFKRIDSTETGTRIQGIKDLSQQEKNSLIEKNKGLDITKGEIQVTKLEREIPPNFVETEINSGEVTSIGGREVSDDDIVAYTYVVPTLDGGIYQTGSIYKVGEKYYLIKDSSKEAIEVEYNEDDNSYRWLDSANENYYRRSTEAGANLEVCGEFFGDCEPSRWDPNNLVSGGEEEKKEERQVATQPQPQATIGPAIKKGGEWYILSGGNELKASPVIDDVSGTIVGYNYKDADNKNYYITAESEVYRVESNGQHVLLEKYAPTALVDRRSGQPQALSLSSSQFEVPDQKGTSVEGLKIISKKPGQATDVVGAGTKPQQRAGEPQRIQQNAVQVSDNEYQIVTIYKNPDGSYTVDTNKGTPVKDTKGNIVRFDIKDRIGNPKAISSQLITRNVLLDQWDGNINIIPLTGGGARSGACDASSCTLNDVYKKKDKQGNEITTRTEVTEAFTAGDRVGQTKLTRTDNPNDAAKLQRTETTTLADGSRIEVKYEPKKTEITDKAEVRITVDGKTTQLSGKSFSELQSTNLNLATDENRRNQILTEAVKAGVDLTKSQQGVIGDKNGLHLNFEGENILTMQKDLVKREINLKDKTTTDYEGNVKRDESGVSKLGEGATSRTFNSKGELQAAEFVKNGESSRIVYKQDKIEVYTEDQLVLELDRKFGFDSSNPEEYGKLKVLSYIPGCEKDCIFEGGGIFSGPQLYYLDENDKKVFVTASPEILALIEKAGDIQRVYGKKGKEGFTSKQLSSQRFFAEVERIFTEFRGLGYYATLFFDEDSLMQWRDKIDKAFATLYLGTEYWSSAICSQYIDGEDEGVAFAETPHGLAQIGAHIEARRTEAIETDTGQEFIYMITFNIRNGDYDKDPRAPEEMNVNVLLKGERRVNVFKNDVEIKRGSTFGRMGRNAIVQESQFLYTQVCIVFDEIPLRWKLEDKELCNSIVESSGEPTPISGTTTTTTTSTGTGGSSDINDF